MWKAMVDFRLCLVTDGSSPDDVATACACGVRAVQYRNKQVTALTAYERSRELRAITRKYSTRFFVNERVDIAMVTGADGVHCPETGFPPKVARRLLGDNAVVGVSVHSVEAALRAQTDGADFVFFGPIFETPSKPDTPPQGTDKLRDVWETIDIPVFAIGGVTPEKVQQCLDAGAEGVAVISAISRQSDLAAAVGAFQKVMRTL